MSEQRKPGYRYHSVLRRRFTDNEMVDYFVMCSPSVINEYFEKYIDTILRKFFPDAVIKDNMLYLFADGDKTSALNCVLGQDLLCPQILMPSFNQIYELYDWEIKSSMTDPLCIDEYVRLHIRRVLRKLHEYERMVKQAHIPAYDYFANVPHGNLLRYIIFEREKESLFQLQKKIESLKKAPNYITLELFNSLIRLKKVVEGLKEYL